MDVNEALALACADNRSKAGNVHWHSYSIGSVCTQCLLLDGGETLRRHMADRQTALPGRNLMQGLLPNCLSRVCLSVVH